MCAFKFEQFDLIVIVKIKLKDKIIRIKTFLGIDFIWNLIYTKNALYK